MEDVTTLQNYNIVNYIEKNVTLQFINISNKTKSRILNLINNSELSFSDIVKNRYSIDYAIEYKETNSLYYSELQKEYLKHCVVSKIVFYSLF